MGDCEAPSTTNEGGCSCKRILRFQKMARTAAATATTPPTTPPAMAPAIELLGLGLGEGDPVKVGRVLALVNSPDLIMAPGYIFGESGGSMRQPVTDGEEGSYHR
jgi:hypothetical protein